MERQGGDSCWKNHYPLALRLYTLGARSHEASANVDKTEEYCNAVLNQTEGPFEDKFGAYFVLVDLKLMTGELQQVRELLTNVLKRYKISFSKNPVAIASSVIFTLLRAKAKLKTVQIDELQVVDDVTIKAVTRFMEKFMKCLFLAEDPRFPSVVVYLYNYTWEYGISESSAPSFGTIGILLVAAMEDFQGAAKYADLALEVIEKSRSDNGRPRTFALVYNFLYPWSRPIMDMLKPLLEGYTMGLQQGDTEYACMNIWTYINTKLVLGSHPLDSMDTDCRIYRNQMKDLKQLTIYCCTSYTHQVILNLMGVNKQTIIDEDNHNDDATDCTAKRTSLLGDACTQEDIDKGEKGDNAQIQSSLLVAQATLLTLFGEYIENANQTIKNGHGHFKKLTPGHGAFVPFDCFLRGVSCFAAAQMTGERKYFKIGETLQNKMNKWADKGNPNVLHYKMILEAEAEACKFSFDLKKSNGGNETNLASTVSNDEYPSAPTPFCSLQNSKNKPSELLRLVMEKYQSAIVFSARNGNQMAAAIASERLGEFLLDSSINDREEAKYRIEEAIRYWKGWGALGKLDQLETKFSSLFPSSDDITEDNSPPNDIVITTKSDKATLGDKDFDFDTAELSSKSLGLGG